MNRLNILKDFFKVWREGRYLGDLVALHAGLNLGTFNPTPPIAKLLQTQSVPDFSDLDFSKMPKGSFGKAYHDFLNPLTEVRNKYNVKPTQIKKAMDPLCLTP